MGYFFSIFRIVSLAFSLYAQQVLYRSSVDGEHYAIKVLFFLEEFFLVHVMVINRVVLMMYSGHFNLFGVSLFVLPL
jgi:hypothetical protein